MKRLNQKKIQRMTSIKVWLRQMNVSSERLAKYIWKNKWKCVSGFLLLIFLIFWLMTYQIARVSGHSMLPTLRNQQFVLIHQRQTPKRYDLIAFTDSEEFLVKRVIGIPGDRIILSGERLLLDTGSGDFDTSYSVTLSSEVASQLANESTIPEGMFFMTGDNVEKSVDSRFIGFVPEKNIKGIVLDSLF